MKALELLYQYQQADEIAGGYMSKPITEAIQELENLKDGNCEGCISYMTDVDGLSFCDSYTKDFSFVCSRGYWLEDNYTKF